MRLMCCILRIPRGHGGDAVDRQSAHHDGVQHRLLVRIRDLSNRSEERRHRSGRRDGRRRSIRRSAYRWTTGSRSSYYYKSNNIRAILTV